MEVDEESQAAVRPLEALLAERDANQRIVHLPHLPTPNERQVKPKEHPLPCLGVPSGGHKAKKSGKCKNDQEPEVRKKSNQISDCEEKSLKEGENQNPEKFRQLVAILFERRTAHIFALHF